MILKACVAGVLTLALLPQGLTRQDFGPDTFTSNYYVERVQCEKAIGTAFKIADGRWISVHHVTSNGGCHIDGKPIHVVHADPEGDFSIIAFDDNRVGGMPFDCGGFRDGEWYYGVGHGWGYATPSIRQSSTRPFIRCSAARSTFCAAIALRPACQADPCLTGKATWLGRSTPMERATASALAEV